MLEQQTFSQTFHKNASSLSRLVVGIPTSGCRFAREASPCLHCAVQWVLGQYEEVADPIHHVAEELKKHSGKLFEEVCIYTPGSILDPQELKLDQLLEILSIVQEETATKRIVIESRPEFVNDNSCKKIASKQNSSRIAIRIPLESSCLESRRSLGKFFSEKCITNAYKAVRMAGLDSIGTVLLKPPGLNELSAIKDVIQSFQWLRAAEATALELEPVQVQPHTQLESQYKSNIYRTPHVWSCISVLCFLPDVEWGASFMHPEPIVGIRGCAECKKTLAELHKNRKKLNDYLSENMCHCRMRWVSEIESCKMEYTTPQVSVLRGWSRLADKV